MVKQTIHASDLGVKSYAKPKMKAYHVDPATIIAASGNTNTKPSQTEEYEVVSTSDWF